VRKDVQDEHSFSRVIDSRDEPVVIAMNVEYRPASDYIRMSEILPHVSQRSPVGPSGDSIPVHEWNERVRMPLGESEQRRTAEHPHY
jgi:hypothetical protein